MAKDKDKSKYAPGAALKLASELATKLRQLIDSGQGSGKEAAATRDALDEPWLAMEHDERKLVNAILSSKTAPSHDLKKIQEKP